MHSKKRAGGLGVGSCSILVIFVLLSLTTFATLALMSAQASYRLAERVAVASGAYYTADATAEEILARISGELHAAGVWESRGAVVHLEAEPPGTGEAVSITPAGGDSGIISYEVPIDSARWLRVELEADFAGPGLRVLSWRVMAEPFQIDQAETAPPVWRWEASP